MLTIFPKNVNLCKRKLRSEPKTKCPWGVWVLSNRADFPPKDKSLGFQSVKLDDFRSALDCQLMRGS